MARSGRRLRVGRVVLWVGPGLLLVGGGVAAVTRMDLERHRKDPERLGRLAETVLPAIEAEEVGTDDWPQWRGPHRDGLSRETGLLAEWPAGGPRVLWKQPLGRGFSSVAVAAGRLYTMDEEAAGPASEGVVCLDARTGRRVWRFGYANHYEERFGSGPRSTPAVDGDRVYAVGPTGIFHCLRADSGEKVWRHDLLEEFAGRRPQYGVAFSPLVEGDLVVATPGGPGGNAVAAFDKRTGRLAWKALDDPMGYSSPVAVTAAGVRQVLVLTNKALVSLSPDKGEVYWRYPWETDNGFNIATPLALGDYVFLSSGYGKGCVLLEVARRDDGSPEPHRVYEHNRMRNHFCSSVRWGDHLYGFDQTDLVCLGVRTGEVAWREKGARTFRKGSLLIADGRLLVLGEDGTLTLADAAPEGFRARASFRVSSGKCWTVPALAGGKLYVRDEAMLVCLELRP
jgi:outer membrane protein assembly factor BamB